jgi:hypothetical protein|tara:strand:+ start:488 stop:820 length:333 start_codon:yes stop_codon:yes gene_type:complete
MSNRILSWSRLNTEYLKWSKDNGEGRDKNDLRFGQYLYIKYDLSEYSVDPFYPEGCENIYAMLARDLHDRYLKDMRKDILKSGSLVLCQSCNKNLVKSGEMCFCQTMQNN